MISFVIKTFDSGVYVCENCFSQATLSNYHPPSENVTPMPPENLSLAIGASELLVLLGLHTVISLWSQPQCGPIMWAN